MMPHTEHTEIPSRSMFLLLQLHHSHLLSLSDFWNQIYNLWNTTDARSFTFLPYCCWNYRLWNIPWRYSENKMDRSPCVHCQIPIQNGDFVPYHSYSELFHIYNKGSAMIKYLGRIKTFKISTWGLPIFFL